MSEDRRLSRLSAGLQAQIDAVCEKFELAWQTAPPNPEIESFVQDWNEPERSILFDELMLIEKEYRSKDWSNMIRQEEIDSIGSSAAQAGEKAGNAIGPYLLIKKLGEGGMGQVWLAEQEHPVKRQVALKVIKTGVGSREVIARFEAERQALALMDHPNVARIIDAGTTDDNQPFFAMELVRGEPLNQYCDQHRLSIEQRLRLFIDACSGVQHAHQKGILHRDLKPGNILVTEVDGQPVPKVIDFGLAKAMETTQRLTDNSLFTEIGRILGTLKYMSPEQAGLESQDIDIRTDVYGLGVILYELLTGSTPLDEKSLKGQAILSVLATIREQDPAKPSSRLNDSGDSVSSITAVRRTDSGSLHRILAGDLDWVVMKALEKDRTRRYDSVSSFAADVCRYLDSEPVIARPPSLNYRVRKFVGKNRAGVLAASLVTMALIGGIAVTSWAMFRAMAAEREALDARGQETTQRELAEARRLEAEQERELAETRRQEAEQNLAYARKGNEILGSVFSGLDPTAEYATVAELRNALRDNLEHAVADLKEATIGDAIVVAEMQVTLGQSLLGLGEFNQGIVILERAVETRKQILGSDHPDTLMGMNYLAEGYQSAGQLEKALPLYQQTLELRKEVLGPKHEHTLNSMNNLASGYDSAGRLDEAMQLYLETLELSKAELGADHPDTLRTMNNLAQAYHQNGQIELARPLYEQTLELMALKLGADHPSTLITMHNLAAACRKAGQLDEAVSWLKQILALKNAKLGDDHPDTLDSMNSLAVAYHDAGHLDKGLPLYEKTLELRKAKLGFDHPDTLVSLGNLARGYHESGELDLALPLYEQTLELTKMKLGPKHPDTLTSMNNLARGYNNMGWLEQSQSLYEQTLELMTAVLGPDHPDTLTCMNNLAKDYRDARQFDKALPLYEQTLELRKNKLGIDHPQTLISMQNLAVLHRVMGQLDIALPLFEQTLELCQAKLGIDHPQTLNTMNSLAAVYWFAEQLDRSIPIFETLLPIQEKKQGREHPDTLRTIANLGVNYQDAGRFEEAIPLLEEAFREIHRDHRLAFVRDRLADAYIAAGRVESFLTFSADTLMSSRSEYPAGSLELAAELIHVADQYLQLSLYTEAAELLREGMEIRNQQAPDAWNTFNARSMLGGCLLQLAQTKEDAEEKRGLLAEAEMLLVSGFEGMNQRKAEIPHDAASRIPDSLDRLIRLYDSLGQPAEVTKYRELRAEYSNDSSAPKTEK